MQKGLATLEIIFAIIIIGVLVKVAVPNAAKILDTAALDYETKKFYSELRFIQEMNRLSIIVSTGTGNTNLLETADGTNAGENVILQVEPNENYYQVLRGSSGKKPIREPHYLSYGVTIFFGVKVKNKVQKVFNVDLNQITGNVEGKLTDINNKPLNGTITLTSRLGKNRYIIFDTVGRIRSSLTPPD